MKILSINSKLPFDDTIKYIYKDHLIFLSPTTPYMEDFDQPFKEGFHIQKITSSDTVFIEEKVLYVLSSPEGNINSQTVFYLSYDDSESGYSFLIKSLDLKSNKIDTVFEVPVDLAEMNSSEAEFEYVFPYYNFSKFHNIDNLCIAYSYEKNDASINIMVDLKEKQSFKLDCIDFEIREYKIIRSGNKKYLFLKEFDQQSINEKLNCYYDFLKDIKRIRKAVILDFDELLENRRTHIIQSFEMDVYSDLNLLGCEGGNVHIQSIDISDRKNIKSKIMKFNIENKDIDTIDIKRDYNLNISTRKVDDGFEFYSYKDPMFKFKDLFMNLTSKEKDICCPKHLTGDIRFSKSSKTSLIVSTPKSRGSNDINYIYDFHTGNEIRLEGRIFGENDTTLFLVKF